MMGGESTDGPAVRPPDELNPRREPVLDMPDLELGAMGPSEYEAMGYRSGLEVHQQLLTDSKLFCRCPAGRRAEAVDAEVLRHMRPTLSEMGGYDGTALMEFKTRKEIVYLLERGTVCTYEMDDTPPFEMDGEAVRIAVGLAALLDLNLVSELHVMRKQYLDGSIPTGFQRTAMVGLGGTIPLRVPELGVDRELRIRQLSLEEDSCREVSDVGHRITFRTDRLGMPLTEVVTEPDLLTPRELQAGARLIADVTRATREVRRGPGAARQDVNVSIAGSRRIEIKGVPGHRVLPRLVHTEAFRQLNLLRIRERLSERGVTAESLPDPAPGLPWATSGLVVDASGLLEGTGWQPLSRSLARGETACAVRLPGFGEVLGHRTQPGTTFAHEVADRIRVIAGPAHRPFMTHSATEDDTLSARHWGELAAALGASPADAIVVVWAAVDDAATAAREVIIRAREALAGVPAETRQAHADGRTGFERILPGADRMYPDTDTPPLPLDDALVESVRAALPETPWARAARYRDGGLDRRVARRLAVAPWADVFDAVAPAPGEPARRLAAVLEKRVPYHARSRDVHPSVAASRLAETAAERIAPAVRALEDGRLLPHALVLVVDAVLSDDAVDVAAVLERYRVREEDAARLVREVEVVADRTVEELPGRPRDTRVRWAMGEVMRELRGRADPARARELLEAALDARVPVEGSGEKGGVAGREASASPAATEAGP